MTGIVREETIGPCRLIQGDCLEVLPLIGRVDAVVTDPPYGVGLTSKQHKWFHQTGDGYASTEDTPEFVSAVVVPAVNLCRKIARNVVVTPGTRCAWLYEQPEDLGTIFNRAGAGRSRWGFGCNHPVLYYGKCPYVTTGRGGRPNSCEQPPDDFAEKLDHPCPKPVGMMSWLVERGSLESETVLDPFMGSGTTGVACIKTSRNFIGIEKEPKYFDIAVRRIRQAWQDKCSEIKWDAPQPLRQLTLEPGE